MIRKIWFAPTLVTLILTIFVVGSELIYHRVQKDLRSKESALVADAVAVNLVNEIENVTRVLSSLSQLRSVTPNNKIDIYNKISKSLIKNYPDIFYAINFIAPDGVIEKIYPVDQNLLAWGRNLMENPEIKGYLDLSLRTKKAVMSHRVMTYQGIYAVVIYEPLIDEKQNFRGWLNAVIKIDVWLREQLDREGWPTVFLSLHWEDRMPKSYVEVGDAKGQPHFFHEFSVLNQKVKMKVALAETTAGEFHRKLLYGMGILGILMLALVSFLLFRLTSSRYCLEVLNRRLNLKRILLNSLAHDISTPLSSLGLTIEHLIQKKDSTLTDVQRNRITRSLGTLNEMLSSVRSLSQLEFEKDEFRNHGIELKKALNESINRVQDHAKTKNVSIRIEAFEDVRICGHESTLVNNVFPNILMNAIKFTKMQSTITIAVTTSGKETRVQFSDQGRGFTENEIRSFNAGEILKSSLGTSGETGSGLGLSQVKGFMELYGGQASIQNNHQGASIYLKFKNALP